jgi:hypothetical protein
MSKARELRILDEIAPLYSRGVTQKDIAARLGISGKQVGNDIQVLKQHWNESLPEKLENARGDLIAKHNAIFEDCYAGYRATGAAKFLELASKELECLGRLLGQGGAGLNLQINQNSVNISAEAVADLFKPLAASDYQAMVATRALPTPEAATPVSQYETPQEQQGLDRADTPVAVELCPASANPCPDQLSEPQYQQGDPRPTALEADWPIAIDSQTGVSVASTGAPISTEPQRKSHRIKHPNQ